ncbi:ROK family protein [Demequina sp. SYSU T00192]|uniref:ROK family protein n=1 Tax=Demequina litoralis TaxID=3051660 RepID=A0ABT8G8Q1_9MICO|nr:ROK family protein [Demequina sp. SYSU T00192]MDN4475508.1 ROK family protein [Demequina sp. SYSU T00192]
MTDAAERLPARDRTRATLLAAIRSGDGVTRGDLVEMTGLPSSTVTHAIGALLRSGTVYEAEPESKGPGSGRGRPGRVLRAVPRGRHVAALDIGHTRIVAAIADDNGTPLDTATREMDVDLDAHAALDVAARLVAALASRFDVHDIVTCAVGIALPIETRTGRVRASLGLSSWDGLSPAEELERRTGIPTHVENDALLGAVGETARGAARGKDHVIFLKISHGIGAGLVLDGEPYRGASGLAGDIGHTKVPGRSELCRCGERGCLEATVSITSVMDQIAATHHGAIVGFDRGDDVDMVTRRILEDAGRELGAVVAQTANLLNPEVVVIGGAMAMAHESFMEGVTWAMREYARPTIAAATEVCVASLGRDATVIGALHLGARRAAALEPAPAS